MTVKLYSAAEIAAMKLPGLPTTKPSLIARAEKEGWHYEEVTGLGGVRKEYEIPSRYLGKQEEKSVVAGAILGGQQVNTQQLASAIKALDNHLVKRGKKIVDPNVKAEIIAILYKQLQKASTDEDLTELLSVMLR